VSLLKDILERWRVSSWKLSLEITLGNTVGFGSTQLVSGKDCGFQEGLGMFSHGVLLGLCLLQCYQLIVWHTMSSETIILPWIWMSIKFWFAVLPCQFCRTAKIFPLVGCICLLLFILKFINWTSFYILCRYVVEKDVQNNVVFVSRNYYSLDKSRRTLRAGSLNWFNNSKPANNEQLKCKVRQYYF
jgi:hypothetical protein